MNKRIFTKQHRDNISKACLGRESWSKGKKMPKQSLYKNMASHLRFNVTHEWLSKFSDVYKLKTLNDCITNRSGRFDVSTIWYIGYINKFYNNKKFNTIYLKWINSGKEKYLKPSIDHIMPRSKGGSNNIENLQFLTWFENRCKNDMTAKEWRKMKDNIGDYFHD